MNTTFDIRSGHSILIEPDDADTIDLNRCYLNKSGYVILVDWFNNKTRTRYLHRLIMNAGKDQVVDHINLNKLDNRRGNLRFVDAFESRRNTTRNTTRKTIANMRGVTLNAYGKFVSQFKGKHLGTFLTEIEAHQAFIKSEGTK